MIADISNADGPLALRHLFAQDDTASYLYSPLGFDEQLSTFTILTIIDDPADHANDPIYRRGERARYEHYLPPADLLKFSGLPFFGYFIEDMISVRLYPLFNRQNISAWKDIYKKPQEPLSLFFEAFNKKPEMILSQSFCNPYALGSNRLLVHIDSVAHLPSYSLWCAHRNIVSDKEFYPKPQSLIIPTRRPL